MEFEAARPFLERHHWGDGDARSSGGSGAPGSRLRPGARTLIDTERADDARTTIRQPRQLIPPDSLL